MKKNARLCASFRADNLQNFINDFFANKPFRQKRKSELKFHKMNLSSRELAQAFQDRVNNEVSFLFLGLNLFSNFEAT